MDSTLLKLQNPWWTSKSSIQEDSHLRAVLNKPYFFQHPIVKEINFSEKDLHILRGPRQVGKTTLLKQPAVKKFWLTTTQPPGSYQSSKN